MSKPDFHLSNFTKAFILILFIIFLVPFLLYIKLAARFEYNVLQTDEDIYYIPPSNWINYLCAGYKETAADLVWIKSIAYFGDQIEKSGKLKYLKNYIDTVIGIDPYFRRVYYWGGIASMYNSKLIDLESVRLSIYYLKKGVKIFPEDGELNYTLGFNLYYELTPFLTDRNEIKKAKRLGAEYMRKSVILGYGPEWLGSAVGTAYQSIGDQDLALLSLITAYQVTKDPRLREIYRQRMAQLRSTNEAKIITDSFDSFFLRWRNDYPYMAPSLYMLIGPKPPINPQEILSQYLPGDPRITNYEDLFSPYYEDIIALKNDNDVLLWIVDKEGEL